MRPEPCLEETDVRKRESVRQLASGEIDVPTV